MRTITSAAALQRLVRSWRRRGVRIGLVPTMGYLHDAHLSLVRRARRWVGSSGVVVVSIYVNPTQFAPTEDLARYPRDWPRDARLCRVAGVDVVFHPDDQVMYPGRAEDCSTTFVVEKSLSRLMEGRSRPTHFEGVTTVVAKLFNLVQPDVAVFGAKDFQQAAVLRRMVRDLHYPVRLLVALTVREPDGLAMSSRNHYLTPAQRAQATVLSASLRRARQVVRAARRPIPAARLRRQLTALIERQPEARVDYLEFFDPETLRPRPAVRPGTQMAVAVFVGRTRLIDNAAL